MPRGRELMLWLDKTMRAWRCAAGKEPGLDLGASEETSVAALPQFLQSNSVVAAVQGDVAPLAQPRLPSAGIHIHAAGSGRCPAGSHALVCFGWVGFQFPGLPASLREHQRGHR